ncbi:MAG TPA: DUF3037 domain-containing protein [Solirubrobacteraceae bacterium]|nr:DUF3037 domain-containing protein [Solirubrobacteraceae bacterium]
MPAERSRSPFSYLILRAVPSVERGECVNVGVVLFCRQRRFLGARVMIDERRLAALGAAPVDLDRLADHLGALVRVAEGAPEAGPIAALEPSERFGWIAAPSSTIVQPSDVHTGLCENPEAMLEALHARLVG